MTDEDGMLQETKDAFLGFFIDIMNDFCPENAATVSLKEATEYVEDWVNQAFEEGEE